MRVGLFEDSEVEYTIDEVVSQIEDEFGFECERPYEDTVKVIIDSLAKITLDIVFNTKSGLKIYDYRLMFKSKSIDMTYSDILLNTYSSAIESTRQVNELLKRMGLYK